ncbi:MAG: Ni/Fe-hydrogenase cytochrome b subunit [Dehalococcoidales bacterium]|nr:Ni/Fe-hydrogenase cytochrome b subunit [Dehalococcoidales bacterium]
MTQKRAFPFGTFILSILVVIGLGVMIYRYIYGLGAISNLSDGRAWGLWISFDLYCGVALAAGGFTLAGAVYIFKLEKYRSVVRPAVLTAFLGYTLVILALLVDLGQPWYIWHIIINWNIHSPLFEVGMCVMTYTVVLALEFSPAVFERLKWNVPLRIIRTIQIPLVIAGVVLSTLHQSSLGSMLLMMPETLHALWYTPILPILFLVSAIAVGPAMVIFESTLSTRVFGHKLDIEVLSGLAKAVPYILGIYLVLKIFELSAVGELGLIFTAYPQNLLWWAEIIIGVISPIILFSISEIRKNRNAVFWTSVLVIAGLVINRFNVSLLALGMRPGYVYFPHWMEFAISAGLVADALLVIWLAHRFLPVAQQERTAEVKV